MGLVPRFVIAASLLASTAAFADPEPELALAARWPSLPEHQSLSLEDRITERLTEIGNTLGHHLDLLSRDTFQLKVDGRNRRARIRLGAGDSQRLSFHFDCGIQFQDLNARVEARLDLGFDGHRLRLELPGFQVEPAEYHGDRGVQIEVPVLVQRF